MDDDLQIVGVSRSSLVAVLTETERRLQIEVDGPNTDLEGRFT